MMMNPARVLTAFTLTLATPLALSGRATAAITLPDTTSPCNTTGADGCLKIKNTSTSTSTKALVGETAAAGGTAVTGIAPTTGTGVSGTTVTGTAVKGTATSNGIGVLGVAATNGIGTMGTSASGLGVRGVATTSGTGVEGTSTTGYGVRGTSGTYGVYGESNGAGHDAGVSVMQVRASLAANGIQAVSTDEQAGIALRAWRNHILGLRQSAAGSRRPDRECDRRRGRAVRHRIDNGWRHRSEA